MTQAMWEIDASGPTQIFLTATTGTADSVLDPVPMGFQFNGAIIEGLTVPTDTRTFSSWVQDSITKQWFVEKDTSTNNWIIRNSARDAWPSWISGTATVETPTITFRAGTPLPPVTPEQVQAQQQRAQAERIRIEAVAQEKAAANEKAEQILRMMLSPEQRDCLDYYDYFYVTGKDGRIYRVRRQWSANIEWVQEKKPDAKVFARYCVHPQDRIPIADSMLTQKLYLEVDPSVLLRKANIHYRAEGVAA